MKKTSARHTLVAACFIAVGAAACGAEVDPSSEQTESLTSEVQSAAGVTPGGPSCDTRDFLPEADEGRYLCDYGNTVVYLAEGSFPIVQVFVVGTDNAVWTTWNHWEKDGANHRSVWSHWMSMGGKVYSHIWGSRDSHGDIFIEAKGGDSHEWCKERFPDHGGYWSKWYRCS